MTDEQWLTLIKTHIRMDADYTEEDTYLLQLRDVALETVNWQVDRPTEEETQEEQQEGQEEQQEEEQPKALLQAALLMIGELYEHREVTGEKATPLPKSYDYLVGTKRRYTVG